MVFLEKYFLPLLIFHLLSTFVLAGSMTHHLLILIDYTKGRFSRQKREFLLLKVVMLSYFCCFITGTLIYPAFSIHMRYEYFDTSLPWATGLFEAKEHLSALCTAILIALFFFRSSFEPEKQKPKLFFYIPAFILINLAVWYKIVIGAWLSLLKGSF